MDAGDDSLENPRRSRFTVTRPVELNDDSEEVRGLVSSVRGSRTGTVTDDIRYINDDPGKLHDKKFNEQSTVMTPVPAVNAHALHSPSTPTLANTSPATGLAGSSIAVSIASERETCDAERQRTDSDMGKRRAFRAARTRKNSYQRDSFRTPSNASTARFRQSQDDSFDSEENPLLNDIPKRERKRSISGHPSSQTITSLRRDQWNILREQSATLTAADGKHLAGQVELARFRLKAYQFRQKHNRPVMFQANKNLWEKHATDGDKSCRRKSSLPSLDKLRGSAPVPRKFAKSMPEHDSDIHPNMITKQSTPSVIQRLKTMNDQRKQTKLKSHRPVSRRMGASGPQNLRHKQLIPNDVKQPRVQTSFDKSTWHRLSRSAELFNLTSLYHDLLERPWNTVIMVLTISYVLSIFLFGAIYFALEYLTDEVCITGLDIKENFHSNLDSFTKAFLLSFESQTTIGYGGRYPRNVCLWPAYVNGMQHIVNLVLSGHMLLVVSQRMVKRRYLPIVRYAENVVVCERDRQLYLLVRVAPNFNKPTRFRHLFYHKLSWLGKLTGIRQTGDIEQRRYRASHGEMLNLVGVTVSAKVVISRESMEGDFLPLVEFDVPFENRDSIFANAPVDYAHKINEESPFYEIGADNLEVATLNLELIVTTTATIASTGSTYQVHQSYIAPDIKYGYQYQRCIEYDSDRLRYVVNFEKFDGTKELPGFDMRSLEDRLEQSNGVLSKDKVQAWDEDIDMGQFSDRRCTLDEPGLDSERPTLERLFMPDPDGDSTGLRHRDPGTSRFGITLAETTT